VRLVNLCFKEKYKTLCCIMYSERQSIYLKIECDVWIGEWWEVLEVSKAMNNSSQKSMFVFCSYLSFIVWLSKNEYPNFWNSKRLQQSIEFIRSITYEMGVILCKNSWSSWFLNTS
jgi:hypothetical protein